MKIIRENYISRIDTLGEKRLLAVVTEISTDVDVIFWEFWEI